MIQRELHHGFSLIELLTTLAIMALLAALAVPLLGDNEALGLDVARRLLISDLEHAQILAITHPDLDISVIVDDSGQGWHIASLEDPSTPLIDSITAEPLAVEFGSGPASSAQNLLIETTADSNTMTFNQHGGLADFTQSVDITLISGEKTATISISPATGSID